MRLQARRGAPVTTASSLRRSGRRSWETRASGGDTEADFEVLFQQVLAGFDLLPDDFDIQRVQDELVGQMADHLGERYDTLAFEFAVPEKRALPPVIPQSDPPPTSLPATPSSRPRSLSIPREDAGSALDPNLEHVEADPTSLYEDRPDLDFDEADDEDVGDSSNELADEHVVSPASSTDRIQSIRRLVADHLGEESEDFAGDVVRSVPVQAGGLYPSSDIWRIAPAIDIPDRLRIHIDQLVREIADEAGMADWTMAVILVSVCRAGSR